MKIFYTVFLLTIFQFTLIAQWISQPSGVSNWLASVHFINQNNGYIAGSEGIVLHTTNGGSEWVSQSSGTTTWLLSVFFTNSNNGWAGGQGGDLFRTTDGGEQWLNQNSGTTRQLFQIFFIDSLNGWIAADGGTMLHTSNGGNSWISQTTGISSSIVSVNFIDSNNGWAVGSLGIILHTTNGGTQWISQVSGTTEILESVYFTDFNNGWAVGQAGTIFHTTNGGNEWISQISGFSSTLHSVHFTDPNRGWAVGLGGTIISTTNGGGEWSLSTVGGDQLMSVFFTDSVNGWTVGDYGTILKYSYEGIELDWCNLQWPPEHTMSVYDSVEVFARVFEDSVTNFPGPGFGIMAWIGYSNENTNPNTWGNWIQAEYNTDVGANDEYYINLSGLNAGTYYYASRFQLSGGDFYYGGYPDGFWDGLNNVSGILTVTSTAVINWCNLAGPPSYIMTEDDSVEIFSQLFVDGVTNIPGAGEGISAWIGYSNENNDPATWNNWVLADYNQDVGGNDEYSQFLSGFNTGTYFYASRFQIDESNYYYGGYPNGFWDGITNISGVLTVTQINYVDEINFKLYRYSLYQNHPNPYNPTTMIRYELPEVNFVTLKIYDVLGNEVATLVNKEKPTGSYEVEFSASNLPSGVYFYRLQAGSFVETKKMVLMK